MDRRAAPGSLLRSFERHLRAQNRSERTVGNYLESARLAQAFLEGRGKRLEQATQADLEDFLGDILRRRSANTAATRYKVPRAVPLAGAGRGTPQPDGAHEAADHP
jgi:site-specific recombinase XerD